MEPIVAIILIIVVAVVVGIGSFFIGVQYRKKVGENKIGSAESEARRIVEEAQREAEATKKEAVIAGKDEAHKLLSDAEHEAADRRKEVQRQERRIQQKEESVDKKLENLEKKDEIINQKIKAAEERLQEAEKLKQGQMDVLEKISGFTQEQAKAYILDNLEDDLAHEKAVKIMEINPDHPVFAKLQALNGEDPERLKDYTDVLYNQALLIAGLPIDDPAAYARKITELMIRSN